MMKDERRRKRAPAVVFELRFAGLTAQSVAELTLAYGFTENGKAVPFEEGQCHMMGRLVELALANIELTVQRMQSMVLYCAAEGLNQQEYLHSQIAIKFKRNLHLVKPRSCDLKRRTIRGFLQWCRLIKT